MFQRHYREKRADATIPQLLQLVDQDILVAEHRVVFPSGASDHARRIKSAHNLSKSQSLPPTRRLVTPSHRNQAEERAPAVLIELEVMKS
jgi:hypothetical protein